jgi:hypothetical protein
VQLSVHEAAAKIGKIELTKRRLEGQGRYAAQVNLSGNGIPTSPSHPGAVELPSDDMPVISPSSTSPYYTPRTSTINPPYPYSDAVSTQDKFMVLPSDDGQSRVSSEHPYRRSGEYRDDHSISVSPRPSGEDYDRPDAPPVPPKTPFQEDGGLRPPQPSRLSTGSPGGLPYPDFDGPPPMVNKLRKPQYHPG